MSILFDTCTFVRTLSNIDEAVKANANFIEDLIDVRNGVKWVQIFDMQNSMCIYVTVCDCHGSLIVLTL